ncbi:hypothetical protein JCM5353_002577, partial [Sporobolomyces roseus]
MASPSPSGSSSPSSLQLPTTSSPRRRPSLIAAGTGPSLDGEQLLPPVSSTDFGGSGQAELLRPRSASGFGSSKSETGKSRKSSSSRRLSAETTPADSTNSPGTFLTRFLGSFRPPAVAAAQQSRPHLPRSLSSPIKLARDLIPSTSSSPSSSPSSSAKPPPLPEKSVSTTSVYSTPSGSQSSSSLTKRFRPNSNRSKSERSASPPTSPSASPLTSPALSVEPPRLSPGSPATLRGKERDPMESAGLAEHFGTNPVGGGEGSAATTPRAEGRAMSRRESMLSQRTLLAHDRTSTAGSLSGGIPLGSPLRPIEEPQAFPQPPLLDQSLQLIATLLPPALLLLSQLGPTHLFSPPLKIPSLFEVALGGGSSSRKSSMSEATDPFSKSDHIQSDRASIASTATADTATTAASFMPGLPTIDHLRPAHSHELHAPSSLSVPAVSASAIWRLFRGFEWIGEVGKGEQPRPPSPTTSRTEGGGGGPFSDDDDEPEQIFDFPSMLQGISDVLAADTAARGIELVIGQVGNGSAPSPAATPSVEEKNAEVTGEKPKPGPKEIESRELLVRADERAWSVALVWILHHIIAGASFGSTIEVRFLATAAAVSSEALPPNSNEST